MSFTVLLVEDNRQKVAAIKRELRKLGIAESDIEVAPDAAAARKALTANRYELLLLDLILPARPNADATAEVGLELLRMIVEDGDLPAPQRIVGTTSSNDAFSAAEEEFRRLTQTILLIDLGAHEWKESLKYLVDQIASAKSRAADYLVDVCFLAALRTPEYTAVVDLTDSWGPERPSDHGPMIRCGSMTLGGGPRKILAAHCSQMGPVTAALTTQALIHEFRPRVIVMTGICGGIDDKLRLGDVVLADRSWDWQSGKWSADGSFEPAPEQFAATQALLQAAQAESHNLAGFCAGYNGEKPEKSSLHVGPMVSGSAVVAQASMHQLFKRQHRKALAVDMECFGLYNACHSVSAPRPAVVCLKTVSDLANRDKGDDYQAYGSHVSAKLAYRMLDRFFGSQVNV